MNRKIDFSMLAIIALMAVTRIHHFGSAWSLPDASLAAFFLAGLLVNNRLFLASLLVEAGLLDYLAINQFGVSDWCLSPAYVFLIPTYAVLWWAGRYSAKHACSLPQTLAWAILATSAAFLISNGSFYLFSGRYAELAVFDYARAVAQYYQPYLASALLYTVAGLLAIKAVKLLPARFQHEEV